MWRSAAAVGLGAFALYLSAVCPTIYWKDSAEFVTVAHFLDVAHPAGSPTYALLAKLLALVPLGDIALRVNVFSALTGALAAAGLFLLAHELLVSLGTPETRSRWIAGVAAGWFALSRSFMVLATTAEVYPLQNIFIIAVLLLLVRWYRLRVEGAGDNRLLIVAALLYGVGAGAHVAMAFFAPAIVLFGVIVLRREALRPGLIAAIAIATLVGLSVYGFLPLRSGTDRLAYDWGNTETWSGFVDHLLVRKDGATIAALNAGALPRQIRLVGGFIVEQLTPIGLGCALLGFALLARRAAALAVLTGGAFFVYVGFFIRYWTTSYGYVPGYLLLALWAAPGLALAVETLERLVPRMRPAYAAAPLAVLLAWHAAVGWVHADKSDYYSTYSLADETFLDLPEGSLVFTVWQWFSAVYLQEVEGRRLDLQIVGTGELKRPDWFRSVSPERFPDLALPDMELTKDTWTKYMPALISANIGERRAFLETDQDTFVPLERNIVPYGFLFEVLTNEDARTVDVDTQTYLARLRTFLSAEMERPDFFDDPGAAQTFAILTVTSGTYFLRRNEAPTAIAMLRLSKLFDPDGSDATAFLGVAHHSLGQFEEAERYLREAVSRTPDRAVPRLFLGFLLLDKQENDEASELFQAVLEKDLENPRALLGAGFVAMKRGDLTEAKRLLRASIDLSTDPQHKRQAERALAELESQQAALVVPIAEGVTHVPG